MKVTCIKCQQLGSLSLNHYKSNGRKYKYYGIQHYDSTTKKRRWCYLGKFESLPDQYKQMIHNKNKVSTTDTQTSGMSNTRNLRSFSRNTGEIMAGPVGFEPTTYSLGGCRAILTTPSFTFIQNPNRSLRHEPSSPFRLSNVLVFR